jgi:hypothetical protein
VSICFLLSLDQRRGLDPKGGFTCPQGELYHNRKLVTPLGKDFNSLSLVSSSLLNLDLSLDSFFILMLELFLIFVESGKNFVLFQPLPGFNTPL